VARPPRVDPASLGPLRAAAQGLHRPSGARTPADIARATAGIQAQDPKAARLAFRARDARLTAQDVDRARTEERSIVRAWVMRRTVHLLHADDAAWMLPLYEPDMERWSRRRLEQLGMPGPDVERALDVVARSLESDGPLARPQLAERIEAAGVLLNQHTRLHVFALAVNSGVAAFGPDVAGNAALVLRRDWLGEPPGHDREAALRDLARRYFAAFAPATETDFAGWSGLPLRDLRAGMEGIAGELTEMRIGDIPAWRPRGRQPRARRDVVRLLPAFDTYLMGHRDRDFIAAPDLWKRVMPGGGILRPAILVDGAAVGTWSARRTGRKLRAEIEPFRPLDDSTAEAVGAEIADVARFEGLEPA
jgi:winged helix DNA-binding protein